MKNLSETATLLYQEYGSLTLTTKQLAAVLHYKTTRVLLNSVSSGTCPVHTFRAGKCRVADIRDVADYLDKARAHYRPR
jgi:hypothetical protein